MNTNNIKKKKKRYEEVAIEIEQSEKQYEELVEEGKKIIELKEREYNNKVYFLNQDKEKTKKQIILDAGKFLEKNQYAKSKDKICARLSQSFKNTVNINYIKDCCPETWKQTKFDKTKGDNGASDTRPSNISTTTVKPTPLTEYEEQYVEVHEQKVYHNEHIEALINYYLGLTQEEKTYIISRTPKGSDYQKALIEKAHDNMLRIAKRLNDTDIGPNLDDIRFLGKIHSTYTNILYEELQLRKRNKEMMQE